MTLSYIKQDSELILSTLDKGLHVLEVLAEVESTAGLTLTELSRMLGMHRTTLLRMLTTLQARGYVSRDPVSDRYQLGMKVLALSATLLRRLDIRQVARPILQALCAETGELVHLVVLDDGAVVTIERLEGNQTISLRTELGARRPAYCTASGKAILATMSAGEVAAILADGMPPMTPRTITSPAVMEQHLAEVLRRGFAWDDEERNEGVRCVAAPIFGHEGRAVGAVSIAAPMLRTPWERLWSLGDAVARAAAAVSRELGYQGARGRVLSDEGQAVAGL